MSFYFSSLTILKLSIVPVLSLLAKRYTINLVLRYLLAQTHSHWGIIGSMRVLGHIEDKPRQCVVKTSFVKTLKNTDRKEFLLRLQRDGSRHWECCFGRRMLHSKFKFPSWIKHKKCMANAGVVELCPRIQLALRKSLDWFNTRSDLNSIDIWNDISITKPWATLTIDIQCPKPNHPSHQCYITDHPAAHISIKISAHLGDGDRLTVCTSLCTF